MSTSGPVQTTQQRNLGLLRSLPQPSKEYVLWKDKASSSSSSTASSSSSKGGPFPPIPPYGKRQNFRPKTLADYGDGGAYPEIHVAQFPLMMGTKDEQQTSIVPLDVSATGAVKYDAVVKRGHESKKVYTSLEDMQRKADDEDALALPSQEAESEAASKTQAALGAILESKVFAARPTHVPEACDRQKPTYIRYTPNPNAPGYSTTQRIVKMVEQQVDPMEPPKHKHSKVPRGAPEPPVPVLHSPPRKVSVADQQSWKIPPCVSNWKNSRGYAIPLDKRLAADGRGLREQTVNNNFATLAEALYIAERSAREEVKARAQIRQTNAAKEKEAQEARLRDLAAEARAEKSAVTATLGGAGRRDGHPGVVGVRGEGPPPSRGGDDDDDDDDGGDADALARAEREEARIERKRDRERQMRLDNAKGDTKRSRLERERERDVSEKIALGLLKGTAKLSGEAQFDKRLFNQSSGLDSGLGQDDDYNIYSKPLLDREEAAAIYRPRNTEESKYGDADEQYKQLTSASKFAAPARPFSGTEGQDQKATRDGPVQFEADPMGIDKFLTDVKKTDRRR